MIKGKRGTGPGWEWRVEDGKEKGSSGRKERMITMTMTMTELLCSRSSLSSTEDIYIQL